MNPRFLDVFYKDIIKEYGRVIHWNSLFGKGHFDCLLFGVRIKKDIRQLCSQSLISPSLKVVFLPRRIKCN